MEVTTEMDIDVKCSECGSYLKVVREGVNSVEVAPCESCVEQEFDDCYERGLKEGRAEGYDEGYAEGHEAGVEDGRERGREE